MHWIGMSMLAEELSSEDEIQCDRLQYSSSWPNRVPNSSLTLICPYFSAFHRTNTPSMHWTAMLILAEELLSEVEIGCDRFQYSTCDGQIESPTKSKNHANSSYDEGMDLRLYPWRVPLHLTIDEGHVTCRFNF